MSYDHWKTGGANPGWTPEMEALPEVEPSPELALSLARDARMAELEARGDLIPDCPGCAEHYRFYRERWTPDGLLDRPFAPPHKALPTCLSGGYPHCTCDSCF